jgi:hypothetical protein
MALSEILQQTSELSSQKVGISEERLDGVLDRLRSVIAFWREYPDLFVDYMCGDNSQNFHLYHYQRVFLRACIRYKYTYFVFPRAYSKSFLSFLVLIIRCILFPGAKLFVTTGGKEQAASIAKEKVDEICNLIPGFAREIDWTPGKTRTSKDMVTYEFKSGSTLDVMAARQASRGKRRTGGLIEECVLVDGTTLNEVIIPTMNISRRLPDGTRDEQEVTNKSQIYVTTAGWKQSFAYNKHMELLIQQIIQPEKSCVMGGTWRIPVVEGVLDKNFIKELQIDGTYNESSFNREYKKILYSLNIENCWEFLRVA